MHIKKYKYELHDFSGNPFDKENGNEVRITVINPYSAENMEIDISYEITLFFDGYHDHYYTWEGEYDRFLNFMNSFFENRVCFVGLNYGSDRKWISETIITKEECKTLDIKNIFSHVFQYTEFIEKLNNYGGEVCCSFWNPDDNKVIKFESI